ncbi:MAG: S8 family serine peptidase [Acidimicrobiia bacterium]|nr:S8 family serine peptidase [Acidimicrobiia bacterium]
MRRVLGSIALGCLAAAATSIAPARAATPSNDYFWNNPPVQWGLLQVGAPAAWTASTGVGITVGVVDSGIEASHEDLVGKVVDGANCVNSNGNPAACIAGGTTDTVGHGTHVAGIIAAVTNNGIGVASMAPDAHLVSAQAVGNDGSGKDADVGAAIRWVVDHGASVVNLSLGLAGTQTTFGPGFSSAVEYAWSHGAVPVVAAGNAGVTPTYGSLHMLVVAGTTPTGQLASYSNRVDNAMWGVAAPGGASDGNPYDDIVSTYKGNAYATIAGSSMAAAHVSGAVALLLAKGFSANDAVQRLLATAVPCGGCGSGRIDAAAAVGAGSAPAPVVPPGGGGSASASPGAATVVGGPPARPASGAQPKPVTSSTTSPPTTVAVTEPPTSVPPTSPTSGPADLALGAPDPGQVRNNIPSTGSGRPSRSVAVTLALVALLGAGGALSVQALRRTS